MKELIYEEKFEKIKSEIFENSVIASNYVAGKVRDRINENNAKGKQTVLGLATGSTPTKVYSELIRMHNEEGLSFKNVVTFNLDEYYPMKPDEQQSYVKFMNEMLFDHVDIDPSNINIPDGTLELDNVYKFCEQYDEKIDALGGLDIQILGIGRTGHIGFNEPGSWEESTTRLVRLDNITREDATSDFINKEVPYRAITMGISSIMKAREIYLLAWGLHKASIIQKAIEGPISSSIPATFLQNHSNTIAILDEQAAEELTRRRAPWLVGMCDWTDDLIAKAVVWLSQKLNKPILRLTDVDYNENGLSELIVEHASAYSINIRFFNRLQHTITGWPGGKPNADDTTRPERKEPGKKRVIIFSPHPDDDVISMGGTFLRLVDQGHDVHVAYQTSGNIAVHDHDAMRFGEFLKEFNELGLDSKFPVLVDHSKKIIDSLESKTPDQQDISEVRLVKGLIRRGEARAGARFCGLDNDHIHFQDLPFYETGKTRKNPVGEEDIQITMELIKEIKPHQIYAAGDLADPHGTHRVCLDAILAALRRLKDDGEEWIKDCWLWLYRGAWHEWPVYEIQMAVPLSPEEVLRKRKAIFMHQSQKDSPPFPGSDVREFWQRAEDRNQDTARIYRELGFAEYEAMEAFVRWDY